MQIGEVILDEEYAIGHHNWVRKPQRWPQIQRGTAVSVVWEPGTEYSPAYRTIEMRYPDGVTNTVSAHLIRMPWDEWVEFKEREARRLGIQNKPKRRAKVPKFDKRLREAIEDYVSEVKPAATPIFNMKEGSVTLPIGVLYDLLLETA